MADISIINKDNTDYKVKDAAGREALAVVENKGAKNQFNIASSDAIDYKTTHNISGDTVTITGNAGFSRYVVPVSLKAGSYIFTANVNSISTSGRVRFNTASDGTGTNVTSQIDFSQAGSISRDFTINQDTAFFVMIYSSTSSADTSSSLVISQCMICTKAEWDISQTYEPYGKTNAELANENANQQLEIDYAINTGVKNLFDINTSLPLKIYHTTYTLSDGSLTVTSNGSWGHHSVPVNLPAGNYIFTATISNFSKDPSASATSVRMRVTDTTAIGGIEIASKAVTGNGAFELPFTWTGGQCYIQYYLNHTSTTTYVSSFTASNNMIRPAAITDQIYEPYALSNPVLTPAAIKAVDCGAKNRLPLTGESTDIFTINADGTMTANGSSSTSKRDFAYYIGEPPKGRFVFSGCPPTGSNTTYRMFLQSVVGSTYTTLATLTGDPVEVDLTNIDKIRVLMSIYAGYTPNNLKFSPMLCTKAEWDISQAYVPYAKTNVDLTNENANQQLEIDYAINAGAKNFLWYKAGIGSSYTTYGRTFTFLPDGGIKITGNNVTTSYADLYLQGVWSNTDPIFNLSDQNYILSLYDNLGLTTGDIFLRAINRSISPSRTYTASLSDRQTTLSDAITTVLITIKPNVTLPSDGIIVYPMLRPAAITDPTFQPYAPTNRELYEACETKVTMQQAYGDAILIPANSDLNNYTTPGIYYALVGNVPTIANTPYRATGLRLVVEKNTPSGAAVFQTIYPTSRAHLEFFRRIYEGGSWSSWYKFEGTEVT